MREISWERYNEASKRSSWTILSLSLIPWFFFLFFFCLLFWLCRNFPFAVSQDLFKRLLSFLFFSKRSLKQARMSNFSPFCRALLPFHYCLLLTGTFLHYYQEALVWGSIRTFTTYSQPVYTWTLPTAFPIESKYFERAKRMVHKPRWQPLGYLSRKLRNKSILLQGFLISSPLKNVKLLLLYIFKSPRVSGGTRDYHDLSILIAAVYWSSLPVITRVAAVITILVRFRHRFSIAIVIFFYRL